MQVITPTDDQFLYFVPRLEYAEVTITYTNVSTQKSLNTPEFPVYTDNRMRCTMLGTYKTSLKLEQGQFVDVNIVALDNAEYKLLYRGRLFCTDQTIDQVNNDTYSVNKDTYTEHESTNDYIIYE
jgi:hypothetical protein